MAAVRSIDPAMVEEYRWSIVAAGADLARAGVLSPSRHGNISVRLPRTDRMLLTSTSSLAAIEPDDLAVLSLAGEVIEGRVDPTSNEIVQMHTAIYRRRDDVGAVIHTHSPFATSFAVANKPLEVVSEALARFGIEEPVPVAAYAPRGSRESVSNIVQVIGPGTRAVLLQNHGLLTFAEDIARAKTLVLVIEEAAQAALNATLLGGATVIPTDMLRYTQQRAQDFAAQGTVSATDDW